MSMDAGRIFPVDVHYLSEPTSDYFAACLSTCLAIHRYHKCLGPGHRTFWSLWTAHNSHGTFVFSFDVQFMGDLLLCQGVLGTIQMLELSLPS